MEQRISLVTLGVTDLERARRFYEALGWRGQVVQDTVFFQAGGQALVLWGRDDLTADAGVDDDGSCTFSGIALAHNVRSSDAVEDIMSAAVAAGATVTRAPSETFYGGYAGCFRDPMATSGRSPTTRGSHSMPTATSPSRGSGTRTDRLNDHISALRAAGALRQDRPFDRRRVGVTPRS